VFARAVAVRTATPAIIVLTLACLGGCDLAYPEVVVINRTGEGLLVKNPSFNGCVWNTVLAYGQATAPDRCLPGADRVHFQKLDVAAYAATADGGVAADGGLASPTWFNYQTVSVKRVDYGDFRVFEITRDDMEQDFSIPGPYGH
jgi:hypothetical protein